MSQMNLLMAAVVRPRANVDTGVCRTTTGTIEQLNVVLGLRAPAPFQASA